MSFSGGPKLKEKSSRVWSEDVKQSAAFSSPPVNGFLVFILRFNLIILTIYHDATLKLAAKTTRKRIDHIAVAPVNKPERLLY
jgi:hypothetical protein